MDAEEAGRPVSIVGDGGWSFGHAWGDANGDGCPDLIVCNIAAGQLNLFYRNNCDGTFDKVTGVLPVEMGPSTSATWGDFDNDGNADLFVANGGTGGAARNYLYRNGGVGSFTKLTTSAPVIQELSSTATSFSSSSLPAFRTASVLSSFSTIESRCAICSRIHSI